MLKKNQHFNMFCLGLSGMLDFMNLGFVGSPHCGLDDSINIARVATRLLKDGCWFRVNEMLCIPG